MFGLYYNQVNPLPSHGSLTLLANTRAPAAETIQTAAVQGGSSGGEQSGGDPREEISTYEGMVAS